ncbi:hypothetical protein C1H46_043025 [Malus baccata]|uniref:Uncharacterized protein n=1 Tax=Malus baccata TaxID=106549 RepID=A0A540KBY4_MALBA|nr:hypothetical protein C1H46_043025 [Malus baccata]
MAKSKNAEKSMNTKVAQPYSTEEVLKVVETLPGAELASDLWWFASELFCTEEEKDVYCHEE